ncbi:MAG: thiolase domain-containing protein [Thermoplasmata archaeon]|nr:MAG: thiolase domain-containing protein [Thermoplasmata archaeon]
MAVYIESVGMTKFGSRKEGLSELFLEAAIRAISLIPDNKRDFDALFVGAMNPAEISGEDNIGAMMADYLGLLPIPAFRVENAPASGSAALHQAYFAVTSGIYEKVLVLAGEKMTDKNSKELAGIFAKLAPEYERKYGITVPALTAMLTRRYMHDFGLTREDLALIPVKSHEIAKKNPNAHFHKEISVDDVLSSPVISDPLRLYDCAPISDGACAAVLTSNQGEVEIVGLGHGADTLYYQHRDVFSSFPATTQAASAAYSMAGIEPKEIDVLETHDAFSILELVNCEDLGLFERGRCINAIKEGITKLGGDLPVNPSGGLKAKGHPVGATGLAQVCELFWQLTDDAGSRKVNSPEIGLTHNIGGFGNNAAVTILKKAD